MKDLKLLVKDYAVSMEIEFFFLVFFWFGIYVMTGKNLTRGCVRFHQPIAKDALTILINLSAEDEEVLQNLVTDDGFLESVLARITVC